MGNVGSIFIKDDQLILLGRKSWKYVRSRSKLKWSLILVALMKKKFFFQCQGGSIEYVCKDFGNSESSLPCWSLALVVCLPVSGLPLSLCHFPAVPGGMTHHYKVWNLLLAPVGSPPDGEKSSVGLAGSGHGLWVSCRKFGNVFLDCFGAELYRFINGT